MFKDILIRLSVRQTSSERWSHLHGLQHCWLLDKADYVFLEHISYNMTLIQCPKWSAQVLIRDFQNYIGTICSIRVHVWYQIMSILPVIAKSKRGKTRCSEGRVIWLV